MIRRSMEERRRSAYAEAGVDVEAANTTKRRMRALVRSTFGPEVVTDIGGFGGLFAPRWSTYDDPVLVSSVDSVGTKLKVAFMMNRHDTVGIDMVNHCVNDILVQGAEPLFFMDYIGMGAHQQEVVLQIIEGLAAACRRAGCALLGGEMATLPGFYRPGEYDLAGTIVGMVERKRIVDGSSIRAGDVLVGLGSDGLHTNGYSLARKLLFEVAGLGIADRVEELGGMVGEELLRPHRSYLFPIRALLDTVDVHGMAHITGGGMVDNIPRILPDGLSAVIQRGSWWVPPIFVLLQKVGDVEEQEMLHTFNMGVGMVVLVSAQDVEVSRATLERHGERTYVLGRVVSDGKGVRFV